MPPGLEEPQTESHPNNPLPAAQGCRESQPLDVLDQSVLDSDSWRPSDMGIQDASFFEKAVSVLNFAIRLLLLPLVALWEFLTLPSNVVWDEPEDYGRPTPSYRSSFTVDNRSDPLGPEIASQRQAAMKKRRANMKIILKRFTNTAGVSWMLTYQSMLYIGTVKICGAIGLDKVLRYFQTDVEKMMARMTGRAYVTLRGERLPYSALNIADPYMEGNFAELGRSHDSPRITRLQIGHLLAMASKLAYEQPLVIEDVVKHRWGCILHDQQHVPAHTVPEGGYVPDMVWYVMSTPKAIVVAFRGANPFRQVDTRADVPIAMTWRKGLGSMCDGFHRGLAQKSPCGKYSHIYDRVVAVLDSKACKDKPFYLTGHSIGGALAAQFAQLLHERNPVTSKRMDGLHNYAAPLVGDADFCRILVENYPGKTFRYVHGSDMVCKLPTGWGYQHFPLERFITSFPRLNGPVSRVCFEEDGAEELEACRKFEDRWGLLLGFIKLLLSPFEEGWTRVGGRVLMLPLPGMTDHFPGDYERALREAIELEEYLDPAIAPPAPPLVGGQNNPAAADVSAPLRYCLMIALRKATWDFSSTHSPIQGPPAAVAPLESGRASISQCPVSGRKSVAFEEGPPAECPISGRKSMAPANGRKSVAASECPVMTGRASGVAGDCPVLSGRASNVDSNSPDLGRAARKSIAMAGPPDLGPGGGKRNSVAASDCPVMTGRKSGVASECPVMSGRASGAASASLDLSRDGRMSMSSNHPMMAGRKSVSDACPVMTGRKSGAPAGCPVMTGRTSGITNMSPHMGSTGRTSMASDCPVLTGRKSGSATDCPVMAMRKSVAFSDGSGLGRTARRSIASGRFSISSSGRLSTAPGRNSVSSDDCPVLSGRRSGPALKCPVMSGGVPLTAPKGLGGPLVEAEGVPGVPASRKSMATGRMSISSARQSTGRRSVASTDCPVMSGRRSGSASECPVMSSDIPLAAPNGMGGPILEAEEAEAAAEAAPGSSTAHPTNTSGKSDKPLSGGAQACPHMNGNAKPKECPVAHGDTNGPSSSNNTATGADENAKEGKKELGSPILSGGAGGPYSSEHTNNGQTSSGPSSPSKATSASTSKTSSGSGSPDLQRQSDVSQASGSSGSSGSSSEQHTLSNWNGVANILAFEAGMLGKQKSSSKTKVTSAADENSAVVKVAGAANASQSPNGGGSMLQGMWASGAHASSVLHATVDALVDQIESGM